MTASGVPRRFAEKIPPSGAWQAGDPVARRQFLQPFKQRPFALEGGGRLDEVTIAYETWGELNSDRSNAILVCHAITGDAHLAGGVQPGQLTPGWWDPLVGQARVIDTDDFFVVCVNTLGGCQGSTGPASINPADGRPYGSRFPVVSMRDMVRTQAALADHLGIECWHMVIGGSAGGMQAIEWAVMYPDRVGSLVSIASAAAASPMQIGWSLAGRLAVVQDPNWRGGDYYDADEGPHLGLMLARRVAMLHYRSDQSFSSRFGRSVVDSLDGFRMWDRFQIESYLDYQGYKFVRRFDANSYLVLNKAMDLHDIGRDRGGLEAAAKRVSCPTLIISIDSDALYMPRQQLELYGLLSGAGVEVRFETLISEHGHDGFLIDFEQLGVILTKFLACCD